MKALILTHPLGTNYGGIMQCYALTTILRNQGYEVDVANMQQPTSYLRRSIKQILALIGYYKHSHNKFSGLTSFIDSHISLTKKIYSSKDLEHYIKKKKYDVVIVGSDQVWKRNFAMKYGYSYFLDFNVKGIKKIAYAASIGDKAWEFNTNETIRIKNLCSLFHGISVREENAVDLLSKNIGIDPLHVLDPTLMFNSSFYNSLISPKLPKKKYVFVYWLWNRAKIQEAIIDIKKKYNYEIIELSMRESKNLPSIEEWLSLIKYAEYVITDSFHGSAFSIIFNKAFNYVHSPEIYDSRRESLFKQLKIQPEELTIENAKKQYDYINSIIMEKQNKSLSFLINCLS